MHPTEPTFSIVVPTYERPDRLRSCLDALAALVYPRERFEVVVVDDGSRRPLSDLVASFASRLRLRLIRQDNAGPAAARNRGAAAATGRFLAFTDDDCAPEADWLRALAERFERSPDHMLGGVTVNALGDNPYSTVSQDLVSFLYEYFNRDPDDAVFFASNNIAVPSGPFRDFGGFDEAFPLSAGEDREFCDRWRASGRRLAWAPRAVVRHSHDLTLRTFWRQHFRYGRGAVHFRRARLSRGGEPVRFEPWEFYGGLLKYPIRERVSPAGLRNLLLMALTQVANALGYYRERLGSGRNLSPRGPHAC